jgi:hypothetical protein
MRLRETPDSGPFWLAKQRQADLIHEAEQYRLAKEARQYRLASAHPKGLANGPATRLLNSSRGSVGRWFAGVRRAFSSPETPCSDPCPDCAPC